MVQLTIREAYNRYYRQWAVDLSDSTDQRYHYDLLRWERLTHDPPVPEITTAIYAHFRATSQRIGHCPETTEQTLRTVRQVIKCCQGMGVLEQVPHPGRSRKIQRRHVHPPTVEEFGRLYTAAGCTTWPRLYHCQPHIFWQSWLVLAAWTGLRLRDLTWKLCREHILDDRIEFRATKTGKLHLFPLTPIIRTHLARVTTKRDRIFGPAPTPDKMRREIRRISELAGTRMFTPHDFRRAAITYWSMADTTAGQLIHGVGLPQVLNRYMDVQQILSAAAHRFSWPENMTATHHARTQLTLF